MHSPRTGRGTSSTSRRRVRPVKAMATLCPSVPSSLFSLLGPAPGSARGALRCALKPPLSPRPRPPRSLRAPHRSPGPPPARCAAASRPGSAPPLCCFASLARCLRAGRLRGCGEGAAPLRARRSRRLRITPPAAAAPGHEPGRLSLLSKRFLRDDHCPVGWYTVRAAHAPPPPEKSRGKTEKEKSVDDETTERRRTNPPPPGSGGGDVRARVRERVPVRRDAAEVRSRGAGRGQGRRGDGGGGAAARGGGVKQRSGL